VGNVMGMVSEAGCVAGNGTRYWPSNAKLGATITSQPEADRDIVKLLAAKTALGIDMVFLSMEPLLGPVTIFDLDGPIDVPPGMASPLDWVIVGGESGPGARPMHPDWARSLRDQCAAAGVPFLFKQWGEWAPDEHFTSLRHQLHEWGEGDEITGRSWRQGKKAAGRLLDRVTHDAFPEGPAR
jgi:protein gp37